MPKKGKYNRFILIADNKSSLITKTETTFRQLTVNNSILFDTPYKSSFHINYVLYNLKRHHFFRDIHFELFKRAKIDKYLQKKNDYRDQKLLYLTSILFLFSSMFEYRSF